MADDMAVAINTKTLVIDSEILDLVAELDEFKGAWRALSTLAPDRLSALRRVATIESIGSSTRIEGNKLSDRDVEKLLSVIEIQTFNTRDEQEVAGYAAPFGERLEFPTLTRSSLAMRSSPQEGFSFAIRRMRV
jgi:Fic family protein